jgi:hypothetical protein
VPTIEIQLVPEDYVAACRTVTERTRKQTTALTAAMMVVVLVAAFLVVCEDDVRTAILTCGASFGGTAGVFLARRLTLPRKARRIFAQTPALQRPSYVTWDDRTLISANQQGSGTYPWAEFHKSRGLAGIFLVFLSDVMFIMIPKRAFPDDAMLRDFRECIQTHVRPSGRG